ncbi:MAG: hypothetical protein K0S45_958 [Nitrospira sp.]|jgi:hypothetical protein|nr:hypothetical protein [Nitrospira sp.]
MPDARHGGWMVHGEVADCRFTLRPPAHDSIRRKIRNDGRMARSRNADTQLNRRTHFEEKDHAQGKNREKLLLL